MKFQIWPWLFTTSFLSRFLWLHYFVPIVTMPTLSCEYHHPHSKSLHMEKTIQVIFCPKYWEIHRFDPPDTYLSLTARKKRTWKRHWWQMGCQGDFHYTLGNQGDRHQRKTLFSPSWTKPITSQKTCGVLGPSKFKQTFVPAAQFRR